MGAKRGPKGALAITQGHWGASPMVRGALWLLGGGWRGSSPVSARGGDAGVRGALLHFTRL